MSDRQMVPWSGDAPPFWGEVVWPEWVPQRVRDEVASFWGPQSGRSPRDYERAIAAYPTPIPALGERVRLRMADEWHEGRYVHAWNNIGRVVHDDGSVACVGTCDYPNAIPAASPAPCRDPLFAAATPMSDLISDPPRDPRGWRWLKIGEEASIGDLCCDPRSDPVEIVAGEWTMTPTHHPVLSKVVRNSGRRTRLAIPKDDADYFNRSDWRELQDDLRRLQRKWHDRAAERRKAIERAGRAILAKTTPEPR